MAIARISTDTFKISYPKVIVATTKILKWIYTGRDCRSNTSTAVKITVSKTNIA